MSKYSDVIENFLNTMREAVTDFSIGEADERECNDETQDLLHSLELNDNSYHTKAKIAGAIRDVRIKRRAAKDVVMQTAPIAAFVSENSEFIHKLERLLGECRKVDRAINNRGYFPKTSIMEDLGIVKKEE